MGILLTQLSYYRAVPESRGPLPRELLACSILTTALGMFYAYVAVFRREAPFSTMFWYWWERSAVAGIWAVSFIIAGIAISRLFRWIRPVLLGLLPAYIMTNISQVVVNIWTNQSMMPLQPWFESVTAQISALSLAALLFLLFCSPRIDGAFAAANAKHSRLTDLPLSLSSWGIGCVTYGLIRVFDLFPFAMRVLGSSNLGLRNLLLSLIIAAGGVLSLFRQRYAMIATTLCLLLQPMRALFAICTRAAIKSSAGPNAPDMLLDSVLECVNGSLGLAAAMFGIYACRSLKQAPSPISSM